jgi:catechol 2,3-dioxygenase-like lactoylglutathione lyase family enzyme
MSTARLKHVLLSSNNLKKTCDFFTKGLGFSLVVCTDTFAELTTPSSSSSSSSSSTSGTKSPTSNNFTLAVQQRISSSGKEAEIRSRSVHINNCSTLSLNFEVADVDHAVKQLLELGGTLDGPIQYTSDKSKTVEKIAAMTTIDGHSIGLFEPKERPKE